MRWSRLLTSIALAAFLVLSLPAPQTRAQIEGIDLSQPVNVSQSGGTFDPIAAVDSDGVLHVSWRDSDNRFFYTRSTKDGWQQPLWITYPFTHASLLGLQIPAPTLVGGLHGRLAMLWFGENNGLRSSSISAASLGTNTAWTAPYLIANSIEDFDVEVDDKGVFHMAYIQAADYTSSNAGVYYTTSFNNGATWNIPTLVYGSSYYIRRSELDDEDPRNTVDLSVTNLDGETGVFVTFDNLARKRVLFSRLLTDGKRWEEPVEVDGPATLGGSTVPFAISVSATQKNVLMTWQVGQPQGVCFNYYVVSQDAGETWSERQRANLPYVDCAQDRRLKSGVSDYTLLTDTVKGQMYFTAWNGKEWSQTQSWPELFEFVDSETLNNVRLDCQVPVFLPSQALAVAGCDQESGQDIWVSGRSLTDIDSWFSQVTGWRVAEQIQSTQNNLEHINIAVDSQDGIHALWSQVEDPAPVAEGTEATVLTNDAIYYSYWGGGSWTKPLPIYSALEDSVGRMTVDIGQDGKISLVWKDEAARKLHYTWAVAARAGSALEWAALSDLPVDEMTADMPDLVVDPSGTLFVVYAVPINENRGIYLLSSSDGGKNWSDPQMILDGVQAGLEVVQEPILRAGFDGTLHLLVGDGMLNVSGVMNRALYLQSTDRGATWTEAQSISSRRVKHYRLLTAAPNTVHRIWQEESEQGDVVYHQLSLDGGETWSRVGRVLNGTGNFWLGDVVADSAGQLHLFRVSSDAQQIQTIDYWKWGGADWIEVDNFVAGQTELSGEYPVAAAVNGLGDLAAVTMRGLNELSDQTQAYKLMFTRRTIRIPAVQITPVALMPVSSPTPEAVAEITETAAPTPTTDLAALEAPQGDQGGLSMALAVSIGASLLAIGLGLGVVFIRGKKLK